MAQFTAQRSLFARLLFGAANSAITWGATGLSLSGGGGSRSLPVGLFVQPMEITNGSIWSGLSVTTVEGTMVLRGFREADLSSLIGYANTQLRSDAVSRIERQFGGLTSVGKQIAFLLGRRVFIRDAARQATVEACAGAASFRRDKLWEMYASAEQRSAFARVIQFTQNSEQLVREANQRFIDGQLAQFEQFFDTVESKPLTDRQRLACVADEHNNLVLAGAGTGKTSTMIGRAGYVLAAGLARADQILMIAYARKAADEMQERQDSRLSALLGGGTPKIKTFHALGLEIIGVAEGKRPDISPMAEDKHAFAVFVDDQLQLQCEDNDYKAKLVRYCGTERFPYRNPFDFESMEEYLEYVRENELRTLKGEIVKSFEECVIANLLNKYGVPYVYEAPYEIDMSGPDFRQYRPDFYLPEHGVYFEHFALDRSGKPPHYFDCAKYLEGIAWKRELHAKHGTRLVETYSYLKRENLLESTLLETLVTEGVEFHPRSDEEMLAELRESSEVADFAVLVSEFIGLFKQAGKPFSEVWHIAEVHRDSQRVLLLLELIAPVLHAYGEELAIQGHIDFADMIVRATSHVETGRYKSPYTNIMVDEFQDISAARARLVMALRKQRPECSLFAVGDDWQAIYRFAGSDLRYTRDFARIFGPTSTTALETTFRFNSKIGDVASSFVLKNPEQITKRVVSLVQTHEPSVSLIRTLTTAVGLKMALEAISARPVFGDASTVSVLVMARFNFVFEDWSSSAAKRGLNQQYPKLRIVFSTVHAAKGKEADFVVVLGLDKGKFGFPSTRRGDKLLECLLPEPESFRLAEERRLFYVALTRARRRAYLVYNPMVASPFIHELTNAEDPYSICTDEFRGANECAEFPHVSCPKCVHGSLVPRPGPHGAFVGCSNYPQCNHTELACPQCGSLMRSDSSQRRCTNPACRATVRICPECGGSMVERSGPYGKFLGCSNYRVGEGFACTHKEKISAG